MLAATFLAFCIALAFLFVLLSAPVRGFVLDRPNERSLHAAAVPRTGGLAIAAGVTGSLAFAASREYAPLLIALGLAAISFGDDLFSLPTLLRFATHLAAAGGILVLIVPDAGPLQFLLLLLGIAWLTNLYNFMDGSDGLAAGMTVIGFGAYAIAAHSAGVSWLATAAVAVAAAAFAFLLFNFFPAKIFMGDSGSIPLGFLAGALGVAGWHAAAWPGWFPVLVFSPFIADASLTLAKRLVRGERVWKAHREHYYQRLVRMGFGHRTTALAWYVLMGVCASIALAARDGSLIAQAAALGICTVAYGLLSVWIDMRWARQPEGIRG